MSQKSATVALISLNKLLLLKRGDTAPWNPGKYCLPGGMVDDNESLIECAIRELFEETGVIVNAGDLTPILIKYPSGYKKTFFVHKNDNLDKDINISWEHSKYGWFSINECDSQELTPNLSITIKALVDNGFIM